MGLEENTVSMMDQAPWDAVAIPEPPRILASLMGLSGWAGSQAGLGSVAQAVLPCVACFPCPIAPLWQPVGPLSLPARLSAEALPWEP